MRFIASVLFIFMLTACGQKGNLYLPDAHQIQHGSEQTNQNNK